MIVIVLLYVYACNFHSSICICVVIVASMFKRVYLLSVTLKLFSNYYILLGIVMKCKNTLVVV